MADTLTDADIAKLDTKPLTDADIAAHDAQHRYTPDEVKAHFANYAPAQGATDISNWGLAKQALAGAGKFFADPMGISHGSGLQVTGADEQGQPMYGVGGPATGPLAPQGPAQEFGATMAASPMVAQGAVGLGKAAIRAVRTTADVIKDPSVLRRVTKAALPHGKEFVEAGEDVSRAAGESRSRALAAEHRAGPQPMPSWRGNPTPIVEPPPEMQSIPGELPSGRQPGPAPPGPELPNRQIPGWANMPATSPQAPPAVQPIIPASGAMPSGRVPGPTWVQPGPTASPRPVPAWANAPEPTPQPAPVVSPQAPAQLPSGRQVGGIGNMKPVTPAPTPPPPAAAPTSPVVNGNPNAQAAAEALKNEMGGTPGEPMVIPSSEAPVTKAQGPAIGRKTKIGNAMERLRGNGVTPQTWKSLTGQEKASATKFINELPGYSKESRAQLLSALEGEGDIPKFAKGGVVAPIPKRSKPGRISSRGNWYGPPGSTPYQVGRHG